jgi:hypothetical protein
MSELREKIAQVVQESLWADPDAASETFPEDVADHILAIPEIREGLYLYSRKKVKAGEPSREPTLGHSIGTRR